MDKGINHSNAKKIYIMLTKTKTSIAKLIKNVNKCNYTHSSISLNRDLSELYSFGRRRLHNFLIAGFIKENVRDGVYAWNQDAPTRLFELEASEESYNKIIGIIDSFKKNYKKHKYNMIGLFAIQLNRSMKRKWRYVCSQFVAKCLIESGAIKELPKDIWLMSPNDLPNIKGMNEIYTGALKGVLDGIENNEF